MLIQDTTTLNYSGQHKRTDIGPLNHDKHQGILLHPTIAVTPERLCLGVIDTYHWAREELHQWESREEKNRENHKIPLKEKESYKWLMSYRKAQEIVKWYLCRWQIEIYFRVLKSGCHIEKLQLETQSRFDVCLTL